MPPPTMMTLSWSAQSIRADMVAYKEETDADPAKFDQQIWDDMESMYRVSMERLERAIVLQMLLFQERHPNNWVDRYARVLARVMAEALDD